MRKIQYKIDFNGYKIIDVIEVSDDASISKINETIEEILFKDFFYEWEDITPGGKKDENLDR